MGTVIQVQIPMLVADTLDGMSTCQAEVIRHTETGFALAFQQPSKTFLDSLERLRG